MKDRPMLFSDPNVRSLQRELEPKTQTRREIKTQPSEKHFTAERDSHLAGVRVDIVDEMAWAVFEYTLGEVETVPCPYGKPGDRLWVREAHQMASCDGGPVVLYRADNGRWHPPYEGEDHGHGPSFDYEQFHSSKWVLGYWAEDVEENNGPWLPSIHMPRWASRITLEIVSIRVERLQDITEEDAIAEGIERDAAEFKNYNPKDTAFKWLGGVGAAKLSYSTLWESINGPGSWDRNPWVWVVEFKRVEGAAS